MIGIFRTFIFVLAWMCFGLLANAQTSIKKELPTAKVSDKVDDQDKANIKRKNIGIIYIYDGAAVLYGNPCATYVTREMNFEYSLENKAEIEIKEAMYNQWHNLGVKTKLFFTRGPFWKFKIDKQLKNCSKQSGDHRG